MNEISGTIDVSENARLALKCIYETNQKFYTDYLISILHGELSAFTTKHGHHHTNCFSSGKEFDHSYWYSVFRQLFAGGYITLTADHSFEIKLTKRAIELLEQRESLYIRKDYYKKSPAAIKKQLKKATSPKKKVKKKSSVPQYKTADGSDLTLFENLKIFRTKIAKKNRTKSFKIFPDQSLMEMSQNRPKSLEEFSTIYGVGPKRLKKFGKIFIEAIEELG